MSSNLATSEERHISEKVPNNTAAVFTKETDQSRD